MTFISNQDKAEKLNHSVPFDVHRWSDYPEVNAAINHLFDVLKDKASLSAQEKKGKKTLKIIVINLLANWYIDPELYSGIHRGKSHYTKLPARYNKLFFKYDVTIKLLNALQKLGFIQHHLGKNYHNKAKNRVTRIKATPRLIDLIQDFSIVEGMTERAPDTECIILRDKVNGKKTNLDYEDTSDTRTMREDLYKYNNLLRDMFISIPEAHKVGIHTIGGTSTFITQNEKFVRRIFNNNSWKEGGRYYGGWWQRIPKEWREKIRIWDLATTEVDYSGLHIVLLYALEGIDYWKVKGVDPYTIEGIEQSERMRRLLKTVLLTAINSGTKQKAIKAVNWHIVTNPEDFNWVKKEGLRIGDLIDSFAAGHQAIASYFFSAKGLNLQYFDSVIAEEVINYFRVKGIPILCIHDSFIIESSKKDVLEVVMDDAVIKAKQKVSEVIISPAMKKKILGLKLSQQDIISSSSTWKSEGEIMTKLYKKYTKWAKDLEEFDNNRTSENYVDSYYQLNELNVSKK